HHLQAALQVAVGVGDGLAVLGGERAGDAVPLVLDELEEAEQDAGAALRAPLPPFELRLPGVGADRLGPGAVRQRDAGLDPAGVGVVDVAEGAGCSGDALSVDVVAEFVHHRTPALGRWGVPGAAGPRARRGAAALSGRNGKE